MSDQSELERIKAPREPPPEQPDATADAEAQAYKKRTPTERETDAHVAHLETWRKRVDYHCTEIMNRDNQINSLHKELTDERERGEKLAVRYASLEALSGSVNVITIMGTIMTIASAVLLGVAGGVPALSDTLRVGLCWGGSAAAACGIVLLIVGFILWRAKKPTDG